MDVPYLVADNSADGCQKYAVEQNNVSDEQPYHREDKANDDTDNQDQAV